MTRPLCISTLDLEYFGHGGVVTKVLVFARIARQEGFDPFFLTPSVALHRTVKRGLRRQVSAPSRKIEFGGYPCHQFGARFPEFEPNAHRFGRQLLREILDPAPTCIAVSGNNHAARPFLDLGLEFSIWPGSTFWEDCRHRILGAPWSARKILDLAAKPWCERLERRIFERARQVVVDTNYTRDCVLGIDSAWADKTFPVPVPVDCEVLKPCDRPARKTLVFIGRLSDPRKNLHLLLESFALAGRERPELELVLIGSADEDTLRSVAHHPFAGRIRHLRGIPEEEKVRELQKAAALVISSLQEGFGIVGAEALACGTPVISTPCGGALDYVIPGETGVLLKGFEPAEMSDAILRLTGDSTHHGRLSSQAREFALKTLSVEANRPILRKFLHGELHA
jgi:glycosyltransferase involved in cell wall biosynthesis